jgi:hypothetical protein
MTREMTLILPYYENRAMFREQQRIWRGYHGKRKGALHVIVVDDASPTHPAAGHVEDTGIASFRLFRTGVDVRWNWLFCRNLGVELATTEWVLLTDMDHVLPEATLRRLIRGRLDPLKVYRLSRVDAPHLTPYKPHPNTWVMTRHMFLHRIGGYDERFSGYYGTDGEFRDRVQAWAQDVVMLPDPMIRYPREVIADASTTTYGRKEPVDRESVKRIRIEREREIGWVPRRLTFPWTQVYP